MLRSDLLRSTFFRLMGDNSKFACARRTCITLFLHTCMKGHILAFSVLAARGTVRLSMGWFVCMSRVSGCGRLIMVMQVCHGCLCCWSHDRVQPTMEPQCRRKFSQPGVKHLFRGHKSAFCVQTLVHNTHTAVGKSKHFALVHSDVYGTICRLLQI